MMIEGKIIDLLSIKSNFQSLFSHESMFSEADVLLKDSIHHAPQTNVAERRNFSSYAFKIFVSGVMKNEIRKNIFLFSLHIFILLLIV